MGRMKKSKEISFRELFLIFRKCGWLMLAVAVLAGLLTGGVLYRTHRDAYTAEARLWVMRDRSGTITTTQDLSLSIYLVKDVIEQIDSPTVMRRVCEQVPQYSEGAIKKMIHVKHEDGLQTFYIDVTASSGEEAAKIANLVADGIRDLVNNTLFKEEELEYVKIIDYARVPAKISNPIQWKFVPLISFVSALMVYGIYFLIRYLSDQINNEDDVAEYLDISVLGVIPNMRDAKRMKSRYGGYYAQDRAAGKGNPS